MSVRAVVFHRPGPAWDRTRPFDEQHGVGEHVAHYRSLFESGKLALGGPFLDDSGGMMICVEGVDVAELEQFAARDPAVESGLLVAVVKPWLVGMRADS